MKHLPISITILILAALLVPAVSLAQEPVTCETTYTVQVGDWLSKIAEKYLGDVLAYPAIADATNSQSDDTYATIEDPDLIEPGWTLCIPSADDMASSVQPGDQALPEGDQPMEASSLEGSQWILATLNGAELLPDTTITASFQADGVVGGTDGCNRYNAQYQVDGDQITVTPGMGTMMACPEPIMQQATDYMVALESAATYQIQDDVLSLLDADGNVLATFAAQPTSLAGTSWTVIGYNNGKGGVVSVIIDTELTAVFGEDSTLSGSAGCNNYTGAYEADDDGNISIGPLAATAKMCIEEDIMVQEGQYLAALETAATYRMEGDRLELRTADGAMAANFVMAQQ